jgi:hypothetical protein
MPEMTVSRIFLRLREKYASFVEPFGGECDCLDEQPALLKKCPFVTGVEFVLDQMEVVSNDVHLCP